MSDDFFRNPDEDEPTQYNPNDPYRSQGQGFQQGNPPPGWGQGQYNRPPGSEDPTQLNNNRPPSHPPQGGGSPIDQPTQLPGWQQRSGGYPPRPGMPPDQTMLDVSQRTVEPLGFLIVREPHQYYGQVYTVRDRTTIGTGPENEVQLYDAQRRISKDHARIGLRRDDETEQKIFVLLDNFSTNGTIVNGKKYQGATIEVNENDEIQIADYRFIFKTLGLDL